MSAKEQFEELGYELDDCSNLVKRRWNGGTLGA